MGRIQSVLLRILSCLIGSFSDRLGNFCSFISHKNGKLLYSMSVVAIQIVFDFSGEPTSIIVLFAGPAVVLFAGPAGGPGCGVHHFSFCRSSWRTGVWRTSTLTSAWWARSWSRPPPPPSPTSTRRQSRSEWPGFETRPVASLECGLRGSRSAL